MSAGFVVQAVIVGQLTGLEAITGVFDGAPARADFPYIVVDAGSELDWSNKSAVGREVAIALTLWDDQPARVRPLCEAIEARMNSLGGVTGWETASLHFVRKRVIRDVAGPWAIALDYRLRLLKLGD